jgi:hypothetical protein
MKVVMPLHTVKRWLIMTWTILVTAGLLAEGWRHVLAERTPLSRFFSLSCEQNAPTWYSSSLLLLCSVCLGLIAVATTRAKAAFARYWWFLAAAFAYISLDELVTLHESASNWFDFDGFLYYGWVIPASVIVTVIGLCYLRFLAHLPRRQRWQFIIAASVFVGGALGVEFVLGYWADLTDSKNLIYGLIDLVQESMELAGVSMFLCSLLEYLGGPAGQLQLEFAGEQQPSESRTDQANEPLRIAS